MPISSTTAHLRELSHLSSLVSIALATNAVSLHLDWPSDGSCHSPGTSQLSTRLGEPLAGTMYILQLTSYIVQCTVSSVRFTVNSAWFLSLFWLYQLVPPLNVGLSSPGSLPVVSSCWENTLHSEGWGKESKMARQKEKMNLTSAPFQQSHW